MGAAEVGWPGEVGLGGLVLGRLCGTAWGAML